MLFKCVIWDASFLLICIYCMLSHSTLAKLRDDSSKSMRLTVLKVSFGCEIRSGCVFTKMPNKHWELRKVKTFRVWVLGEEWCAF